MAKMIGKGVMWVVALLLTAAVTQEIATRYADRQQADDLRSRLTAMVSRASVLTYNDAFEVVYRQWRGRPGDYAAQRNRVTAGWTTASAEIDPLLYVHFRDSEARRHWKRYQSAVYSHALLSHVDPGIDPAEVTEPIRQYLSEQSDEQSDERSPEVPRATGDLWPILHCREKGCNRSPAWRNAYRELGHELLSQRGSLADDIARADADNLG